MKESRQAQRKDEHLSLATKYYDQTHTSHPFDQVRLIHTALPESTVAAVDLTTSLAPGIQLTSPFYLEAMTGGSKRATEINRQLARLAARFNLAMASGSVSVALKEPRWRDSFQVIREENPDGIVIANLGADASVQAAREAIDLLGANALELHLNAAQELVMPEGDRAFHWLDNISHLVDALDVPIIVKEVGFGMQRADVARLADIGVTTINISGRGGTNFALIENRRNHQHDFTEFTDWGQTTPEALLEARAANPTAGIIASGGITSPLDVVKAGVLGAQASGVAGYFLNLLVKSGPAELARVLADWQAALPRLLALLGCQHYADLRQVNYVLGSDLYAYAQQRNLI